MTDDDRLADLLRDAVSGVEPPDRLTEIRSRTSRRRTPWRRWAPLSGAVLATAAVVTAAALGSRALTAVGPGPAATPPAPSPPSAAADSPRGTARAVAAYFVGETADGPRLFREFQRVAGASPGRAGLQLLESGPRDPDYRTLWPTGSFRLDRVSDPEAGLVHVHLAAGSPAPTSLAQQQVVHTVSAGFGEPLSVVFHRDGTRSAPVAAAPRPTVVAPVNLSDPSEGQVTRDVLRLQGVADATARDLHWRVLAGSSVVLSGDVTPFGTTVPGPAGFVDDLDVSTLDPGTYTVIVETDGSAAYSDTRTFVLE